MKVVDPSESVLLELVSFAERRKTSATSCIPVHSVEVGPVNAKCVYRGDDIRKGRLQSDYVRQLEEQVRVLSAAVSLPTNRVDFDAFQPPDSNSGTARDDLDYSSLEHEPLPRDSPNRSVSHGQCGREVSGVNKHTRNVEFYGSSSSVVLLSEAQKAGDVEGSLSTSRDEELVSNLHNPAFSPGTATSGDTARPNRTAPPGSATYYQQCRPFLDGFFTGLHCIQPIIDKASFLSKCTTLWKAETAVSQSFIALYYSLLSLGALISIRDDEPVDGIENLEWSRIFFEEARSRVGMGMTTDVETVQCYYFLAKICQNELNHHSAYMYGGQAVRTALAIGINREPQPGQNRDPMLTKTETRTWWALYSLEIEMSSAVGRPDSLGADVYHNRPYPAIKGDPAYCGRSPELMESPSCAMIKAMVDFSRIIKAVILGIYLADSTLEQAIDKSRKIEQDLERWLENLPVEIRPNRNHVQPRPLKATKDPQYAKKQRLVLKIRYHNVRILLFGFFLTRSSTLEREAALGLQDEFSKCVDSAKQTIEIIYDAYQYHDFFSHMDELAYLYKLVEMAIEILEIMDESVVATQAAKMFQETLMRARTVVSGTREEARAMELDKMMSWPTQGVLFDFNEDDFSAGLPFPLGDPPAMYPLT
ncbi:hypothetical protein NM208_g3236 [Fusarium decemcellulare]|uniref:Uncharacterized protein n=1 Tax=Fusarium decemcellulare TaxID=57161 RepID=A0ACC1SQ53_9HYPO|nr:hypothetical protein NM208_g3236 [Fusarium decemcellulare]